MCSCEAGWTCSKCRAEDERYTKQDERDLLDALCGVSDPWHDLDDERMEAMR